MARARTLLIAVMACALALVPAVALAAGSQFAGQSNQNQPHKASSHAGAASAASEMPCHGKNPEGQKPSGSPSHDSKNTCKHCNGDGCATDAACALKCFKLVGGLPNIAATSSSLSAEVFVALLLHPHDWSRTPPAPPPRA